MKCVLCVESSAQRGMGHLFRSLLFAEYFKNNNIEYIMLINNDPNSLRIYDDRKIIYEIEDYQDNNNWERDILLKYHPDVWINDKF